MGAGQPIPTKFSVRSSEDMLITVENYRIEAHRLSLMHIRFTSSWFSQTYLNIELIRYGHFREKFISHSKINRHENLNYLLP